MHRHQHLSFGYVVGTTSLAFVVSQLDVSIVNIALPAMAKTDVSLRHPSATPGRCATGSSRLCRFTGGRFFHTLLAIVYSFSDYSHGHGHCGTCHDNRHSFQRRKKQKRNGFRYSQHHTAGSWRPWCSCFWRHGQRRAAEHCLGGPNQRADFLLQPPAGSRIDPPVRSQKLRR